jgi:CubicO group peptidase (beta-lactamase class C family)
MLTQQLQQWEEENSFPELNSLLIWYQGGVLYENYYNGFTHLHLHEAQSVTKSIQSILVGIALDKGLIANLDVKIKPFFREYDYLDWRNGKDQITLRHLLTMQSGLQWNESQVPYNRLFENDSNLMAYSDDWLAFALSKPMVYPAGNFFCYSSASPILISKILKVVSGMSNEAFAKQFLFDPLECLGYDFQKNPKDPDILGDVDLLPSDLLKIGVLALRMGEWQGKKLVSAKWIQTSTQKHVNFSQGEGYGFCWWLKDFQVKGKKLPCFYAWGYGGQHLFVFKDLDLVVLTNARKYTVTLARDPFDLVEQLILPNLF